MPAPVTLRPPAPGAGLPELGTDQERVIAHRGPAVVVLGAAGTGRTTTAVELMARRIAAGLDPDRALLLAPTRRSAATLRDRLAVRLGRTVGRPLVRTPSSAAFAVLRSRAALLGERPPVLISGPEQDLVLGDLLAGHAEGEGARVAWPPSVPPEALGLRAFRDELRDLLMRAAERGMGPADLRRAGRRHARPEWVAAAAVYAEYLEVTRLQSGTPDSGARLDAAVVVDEAAEALAAWRSEVPGTEPPAWDLVVVDDYQEATAATARLLHAMQDGGAQLRLMADPDLAAQTFRGASPDLVGRAGLPRGVELGAFGAEQLELEVVRRHGAALRTVVRTVTEEIRSPVRSHRRPSAEPTAPGSAEVRLLRSEAQEAAYVTYVLRAAHLHDDVPWSRMAVVVRSGGQVMSMRRALLAAQVPVAVVGSDVPLRAEAAVRPLLRALTCVLDTESLDAETAAELLGSPLGGLDAVGLRRVRRALRASEIAAGGGRSSDPLLVEVLGSPAHGADLPPAVRRPVTRLATVLAAGRAVAAQDDASVLDVLWALWSAADLADRWRRSALAGGPGGARADRDLDAVMALFRAAEQFVDRLPQAPAHAFIEHLESQDLPADSLAAHGDTAESVAVLTAAGAAGGEWDVVVVAGVQEGVWPDLRLRDSMLGAQQLVDMHAGRAVPADGGPDAAGEARHAVLDDELRAFAVAVSRARRQLVVTAVRDTDHQPSGLVDLVDPGPVDEGTDPRLASVPPGLDLRAVVAQCRAELEAAEAPDAQHPAARLLATLASHGVPGADPAQWYGTAALSSTEPLWPADVPVPLSPSGLDGVATCALRWALESAGGRAADSREQSLGTLIHAIAADLPTGTPAELRAALDARWHELGLGEGWVGAVQRRRAEAMIAHLAAYLAQAPAPLAVEAPFHVQLGRVVLRGSVDRLEAAGPDADGRPRLRVVDLKTGRSAVTKDEAARHAQLGAYQAAVEAGAFDDLAPGATAGGACLVYVGRTTRTYSDRAQCAPADDDEPDWVATMLTQVLETVTSPTVGATPGPTCRTCPVRRSCPAQPEGRGVGA